jgi:hypothetical protein
MNILNQTDKSRSILKKIVFLVVVLIAAGLLLDLQEGLYYLSHFKSIYAALVGLMILGLFYLIGEAGSEWIGGHDDVKDPLHKRILRLFALLIFGVLLMTAMWFAFRRLGLMRI